MNLYDRTTEDSLSELAKAGCLVDLAVHGYGEDAKFRLKIKKGSGTYGNGFEISAEGDGADGAAAIRGAVATAETFLHTVPTRHAPKVRELTEAPLLPPTPPLPPERDILADLGVRPVYLPEGGPMPVRPEEPTRERNIASGATKADDERAREIVASDEEIAF